jgi:hypothetical protein
MGGKEEEKSEESKSWNQVSKKDMLCAGAGCWGDRGLGGVWWLVAEDRGGRRREGREEKGAGWQGDIIVGLCE